MIILLIRKSKKTGNNRSTKDTFSHHNEAMKNFRLAHPDLKIITARDILTGEGNLLAPVRQVKLSANSQN